MSEDLAKQLEKTQQELEKLKQQYQEFVYVVSHDLTGPLRQIEGFTEIIAEKYADQFDDKTKRHIKLIIGGSSKAKEMLEALLVYSRLSTSQKAFALVDCNEAWDKAKEKLSSLIESNEAEILCHQLPGVTADATQISTLFYHLLHNSLLYQPKGNQPKISIEVSEKEKLWQFAINDNGIGIPERARERVFTILRRGVADKQYPGLGMGLAFARRIVQNHGGEIWIDSEKKEGSRLIFTLVKDI